MDNIDAIMAAEFAEEEAPPKKGNGLDEETAPAGSQADEAMPLLPDGRGLDYEDIRMMLSKQHKTMLGNDEPIMMMVTLCNVFLGELEKPTKSTMRP